MCRGLSRSTFSLTPAPFFGDLTVVARTHRLLALASLGLAVAALSAAAARLAAADGAAVAPVSGKSPAAAYATDLSAMPVGKPPDELFILNGGFKVVEAGGNKFLELPGNPLDSFGVLFGPEDQQAAEVSARISGTAAGRMFPEYGVGTNDAGGWKLWAMPGQGALALRKKDADEVARVPFAFADGKWTRLKLRVAPAAGGGGDKGGGGTGGGKWQVQGKAWADGEPEPAGWTIAATDDAAPPKGRASVWGHPYAGTPIRFDDLSAGPAK
ncbi:MAG: hypothetical protein JWO31_391 [Phycisphaerales bacterium]|nr:hypothetical protein [Phycisphaerales bacterium]